MNRGDPGWLAAGPGSPLYRPPEQLFRGSLGRFATGVAVVAFDHPDGRFGLTINSFTSVSMEPPLVLVSIGHSASSHVRLEGRAFTVNILAAEQQDLALTFSGKPGRQPTWIEGRHAPRLAGVLCWFECEPYARYPGGDHTLFLGEVRDYGSRAGDALGFFNGSFTTFGERRLGHEDLL